MSHTTYTIQMASTISGVGVHTIRAWEKRYQALIPHRDDSGHRVYTKTDIEKLILLSELCFLGYTISKVAKMAIPELKLLLVELGKSAESLESVDFNLVKEAPELDVSQSLSILSFALKNYKVDVISQELGKLKSALTSRIFALEIIYPLGTELGSLVKSGHYAFHQEEAVRSVLNFHLGYNLYRPLEKKERGHLNVIVSGVEGARANMTLSCVGLLCQHYGYNYTYVEPGLSYEALSDEVRFLEAAFVILAPNTTTHFPNYIAKLMSQIPTTTSIVVAGNPLAELEHIDPRRLRVFKTLKDMDEFLSLKHH